MNIRSIRIGRREFCGLFIVALVAAGCAAPGSLRDEAAPAQAVLTDAQVAAEVSDSLNSAFCACQQRLMTGRTLFDPALAVGSTDGAWTSTEDPALNAYKNGAAGQACLASIPVGGDGGSSHPSLVRLADANHCVGNVRTTYPSAVLSNFLAPGLCRANFNYCVAHELRLRTEAYSSAPSDPRVRVELMKEARVRLASSGIEYASSVGFYQDLCPGLGTAGQFQNHSEICTRLSGANSTLAATISSRIGDTVNQLQELAEVEVRDREAIADERFSSGVGTASERAASVWSVSGARTTAAAVLMGDPTDSSMRIIEDIDVQFDRALTGASASAVDPDFTYSAPFGVESKTEEAFSLLEQFQIPVGLAQRPAVGGAVGEVEMVFVDPTDTYLTRVFNLLDHRLAAHQGTAPYDTVCQDLVEPAKTACDDVQHPLLALSPMTDATWSTYGSLGSNSVLQAVHHISKSDVREAIRLMRARIGAYQTSPRTVVQIAAVDTTSADATNWSQLAVVTDPNPRGRSPVSLASALARERQSTGPFADAVSPNHADPFASILPASVAAAAPSVFSLRVPVLYSNVDTPMFNWYSWDAGHLSRIGVVGNLHHLRVHLRRLASSSQFPALEAGLDAALVGAESAVGTSWFEWDTEGSVFCPSSTGTMTRYPACADATCLGTCGGVAAYDFYLTGGYPSGYARTNYFDLYFSDSVSNTIGVNSKVLLVASEEDALCLGRSQNGCSESSVALASSNLATPTMTSLGVKRARATFSFSSPSSPSFTVGTELRQQQGRNFYVVLKNEAGEYNLIDIVGRNDRVSVHSFGGTLGSAFTETVTRSFRDPGQAQTNSLGFDPGFVPPLENALINNGSTGPSTSEDSWQTYLSYAQTAAVQANALIDTVRTSELSVLREDRADEALLTDAQAAEANAVSAGCGSQGAGTSCAVPRALPVHLADVIHVPELAAASPITPEIRAGSSGFSAPGWPLVLTPDESTSSWCSQYLRTFDESYGGGFDPDHIEHRYWDEAIKNRMVVAVRCAREETLKAIRSLTLNDIPQRVVDELQHGGIGTFSDLQGEVQEQHIQMFQRLKSLERALDGFDNTVEIAARQLEETAAEVAKTTSHRTSLRCKFKRAFKWIGVAAALAGSIVAAVYTGGGALAITVSVLSVVTSASGAATVAVGDVAAGKCGDQDAARDRSASEAALDRTVATLQTIHDYQSESQSAVRDLAMGDNELDSIQRRVMAAQSQYAIQQLVISSNSLQDMPEWRALAGVQARRAREAMFRAQQYAFVARRAIELRLPAALSQILQAEPFVSAPATWADSVFTIHMSSASGDAWDGSGSVSDADDAIVRYSSNLDAFMQGYTFNRRVVDGVDQQVLNLRALDEPPGATVPSFHERLSYKCVGNPTASSWATVTANGTLAPCGRPEDVEYAQLSFELDQNDPYVADRIAYGSFNYRHERVALNFVGTGVVDCSQAVRPSECYRDQNLQFTLRQDGFVYLQDFSGSTFAFQMEPGVIADSRALVATRVLGNPLSSTDTTLLSNFERAEYWGRPLFGRYELRIEGRKEVNWAALADVQMMIEYRYWTRQQ